jgi:hypothetical protein
MSSQPMSDEKDPVIWRLFAEQDQRLPSEDFMFRLGRRIDAQQRARRVRGAVAIIACLLLSALIAPWIAQLTAVLIGLAAATVSASGPLLSRPLIWLVVGATLAGCSPVIYLWRTGRW